jgi:hypothetical protein
MGFEDSHPKRGGGSREGDGTWGPFLRAMKTGISERTTSSVSHSPGPRTRQGSLSECHPAGSLKYGPNPTAHGVNKPLSNQHPNDPHCTWGAFFQACSAGIREDATTIRRRLSNLPLPPSGPAGGEAPMSPVLIPSNLSSRGSNLPAMAPADAEDWDNMAGDVRQQ